ncbi:hypothetical protein AB0J35_17030 [Nonomuraea angiospora]
MSAALLAVSKTPGVAGGPWGTMTATEELEVPRDGDRAAGGPGDGDRR